ncbi:hypothetical protein MTO96_040426 [Rhipicephalus appendiculatus]
MSALTLLSHVGADGLYLGQNLGPDQDLWSTVECRMHNVAGYLYHCALPLARLALRRLGSANYSLSQGQGTHSGDHGQGSSCFPGNPLRKIKAIIVTSFGSSIKLCGLFLLVILVCSMQGGCRAVPVRAHASPGSGFQVLARKFVCHKEIEFISSSGKTSGLHWLLGNLLRVYAVNLY